MGSNVSDRESEDEIGYPPAIAMPKGMGVRNERPATVRERYLACQSDLTDEQAEALAWRELDCTATE
jgi:hypothetical protein